MAGIVLLYLARLAVLFVGASEGDIPSASLIPQPPSGAQVVSEGTQCSSGGCWRQVVLRPAAGQSPDQLAAQMDLTTTRQVRGNLLDPRTVYLESSVLNGELRVVASFRS